MLHHNVTIHYFLLLFLFQTALFKTHTMVERDATGAYHEVVMLENEHDGNVVAINKDEDTVIAKVINISLISSSKLSCISLLARDTWKETEGKLYLTNFRPLENSCVWCSVHTRRPETYEHFRRRWRALSLKQKDCGLA